MIIACLSCLTTWGPDKESVLPRKTNWENSGGAKRRRADMICPANLPESFVLESILAKRCTHHQEGPWVRPNISQARWWVRDNPENNLITIKPETACHVAEQFSWVPLPCCSLPGLPFPIKSFALSVRVSLQTIHFQVLDKSALSGPGRGPPSCSTPTSDLFFWSHWLAGSSLCTLGSFLPYCLCPYRSLLLERHPPPAFSLPSWLSPGSLVWQPKSLHGQATWGSSLPEQPAVWITTNPLTALKENLFLYPSPPGSWKLQAAQGCGLSLFERCSSTCTWEALSTWSSPVPFLFRWFLGTPCLVSVTPWGGDKTVANNGKTITPTMLHRSHGQHHRTWAQTPEGDF